MTHMSCPWRGFHSHNKSRFAWKLRLNEVWPIWICLQNCFLYHCAVACFPFQPIWLCCTCPNEQGPLNGYIETIPTFGRFSFDDCGALLKSGARGMGRGQGDMLLEPSPALEGIQCFCLLCSHRLISTQCSARAAGVALKRFLLDKNSGA